jgi:dolichol-phosphate mannosyltransferase
MDKPLLHRCIVIVPTYNERENIQFLVSRLLLEPSVDILFVDDSSPDGTQNEIKKFIEVFPGRIQILSRDTKDGLGGAYLLGMKSALDLGYEFIAQMDADGSHRVVDFARMLKAINSEKDLDIVVGSRWVPGGAVENWPKNRILLSRSASLVVSKLLSLDTKDVTSGFKIFRRSALDFLMHKNIQSMGYCFQIEIAKLASSGKLKTLEVPIIFPNRIFGDSKISINVIIEASFQVIKWFFQKE